MADSRILSKESGSDLDDVRKALEKPQKRRKYRIKYIEDEHGPLYTPDRKGLDVVVRINKRHPFFTTFYTDLARLPGGNLAKEAVDLVLIALARGEVEVDSEQTTELYRVQREQKWSPFLSLAMRTLAREYPEVQEEDEDGAGPAA